MWYPRAVQKQYARNFEHKLVQITVGNLPYALDSLAGMRQESALHRTLPRRERRQSGLAAVPEASLTSTGFADLAQVQVARVCAIFPCQTSRRE